MKTKRSEFEDPIFWRAQRRAVKNEAVTVMYMCQPVDELPMDPVYPKVTYWTTESMNDPNWSFIKSIIKILIESYKKNKDVPLKDILSDAIITFLEKII